MHLITLIIIYGFTQTLLGVRGSILLEQLLRIIPVNFRNYRHQYIANVLNCALKMSLTPADVKQLVIRSRGSPQMQDVLGSLLLDLLWDSTFQHGLPQHLLSFSSIGLVLSL